MSTSVGCGTSDTISEISEMREVDLTLLQVLQSHLGDNNVDLVQIPTKSHQAWPGHMGPLLGKFGPIFATIY